MEGQSGWCLKSSGRGWDSQESSYSCDHGAVHDSVESAASTFWRFAAGSKADMVDSTLQPKKALEMRCESIANDACTPRKMYRHANAETSSSCSCKSTHRKCNEGAIPIYIYTSLYGIPCSDSDCRCIDWECRCYKLQHNSFLSEIAGIHWPSILVYIQLQNAPPNGILHTSDVWVREQLLVRLHPKSNRLQWPWVPPSSKRAQCQTVFYRSNVLWVSQSCGLFLAWEFFHSMFHRYSSTQTSLHSTLMFSNKYECVFWPCDTHGSWWFLLQPCVSALTPWRHSWSHTGGSTCRSAGCTWRTHAVP